MAIGDTAIAQLPIASNAPVVVSVTMTAIESATETGSTTVTLELITAPTAIESATETTSTSILLDFNVDPTAIESATEVPTTAVLLAIPVTMTEVESATETTTTTIGYVYVLSFTAIESDTETDSFVTAFLPYTEESAGFYKTIRETASSAGTSLRDYQTAGFKKTLRS